MSRVRNTRRSLSLLIGFLTIVFAVQFGNQSSDAQRKSKPAQQKPPIAKPSPTAVESLGPAPPIPLLKKKPEAPKPEPEVSAGDVISVNTTEVMIPITVRDSTGRLVSNLTKDDFKVFEDGSLQPLSDIALRQVPVDVALMVDSSSSVAANLDDFRKAAEGFAARLAADDRISLIKFDDRVELLLDWTKSRYQLRRALNRVDAGMFTRFNDALLLAARDQFSDAARSRRAVIVLTDGIDHGSGSTTLETALQSLLRAQVNVYVVSNTQILRAEKLTELDALTSSSAARFNQLTIDSLRERIRALDQSEDNLAQLTAATGGRLYKPLSFRDLESTYAEVADELRHQYALYYTPVNKARNGAFRRIKVETSNPSYRPLTRVGYFAPKS